MKLAILGSAGVPANYGGFETLAENLLRYRDGASIEGEVTVYCSGKSCSSRIPSTSVRLKYVPLKANGVQSIPYDILSLFSAVWNQNNAILLLGVSGAIALPLVRLVSSARIVTNIDGMEWRREKWRGLARRFLKFSEEIAVRFSHTVIADNTVIAEYVREIYGADSVVIAYGGDHAVAVEAVPVHECSLPARYALSVCRIEPENNVHLVLGAFSRQEAIPLVMVGNWSNSGYGRALRERYAACDNLFLLDPIYDLGKLKTLRSQASLYVHGHKAGGTNPSLVEAMHFGKPILAFACSFNRATTEDKALFFTDEDELLGLIRCIDGPLAHKSGEDTLEVARRRYTWNVVAERYFSLLRAK